MSFKGLTIRQKDVNIKRSLPNLVRILIYLNVFQEIIIVLSVRLTQRALYESTF